MNRIFASLALLLSVETIARADVSPNDISISTFDPENAVAPESAVEGPGVKIGEGTVLHPVFGMETGVVSNVFYTQNNPQAAGILRLLAQVGAGSLSSARLIPTEDNDDNSARQGDFQYKTNVRASYDAMLSGDSAIQGTGGLGVGALFRGMVNPNGRWSFGFDEEFDRLIRAANFETDANTNRDINGIALTVLYHPNDSAFGGYLYYNNTIDIFEANTQNFADRIQHRLGIHPMWRWLPQTTVFADVSIGYFSGLGSGTDKVTSYPFTAIGGIATLLSLKTTLNVQAGYTNGFYSSGPSFSAPTIGASLGYRYSPLGRVLLTYDWLYQDSVNANYYRDHVVRLWIQQLVNPFVIMVQPEIHFREYQGVDTVVMGAPPTRDDFIFSVIAGVHYNFRNWAAATLDYHFTDVSTNFRFAVDGMINDPSYARHELLLGVRIAM
jgi:hypothetical protein